MSLTTMPRPRKKTARGARSQPKAIAFRVSDAYATWVEELAAANRSTIAGLLDQALARHAREIGFTKPIPER